MNASGQIQEAVLAFLGDEDRKCKRIDTHASIVFLEQDRVLKLKRAVRMPGIDVNARRQRLTDARDFRCLIHGGLMLLGIYCQRETRQGNCPPEIDRARIASFRRGSSERSNASQDGLMPSHEFHCAPNEVSALLDKSYLLTAQASPRSFPVPCRSRECICLFAMDRGCNDPTTSSKFYVGKRGRQSQRTCRLYGGATGRRFSGYGGIVCVAKRIDASPRNQIK
jgi:hypothetical protein